MLSTVDGNQIIAVLEDWGSGFLSHPANGSLRQTLQSTPNPAVLFYRTLLCVFYRILHLSMKESIPNQQWVYFQKRFALEEEREKSCIGLWSSQRCEILSQASLFSFDTSVWRSNPRVTWKESLGGLHEILLSFSPQICWEQRRLVFTQPKKNYRKRTGAYYTPPRVVQSILQSMHRHTSLDVLKKEEIRICDPACGCGNFLIAGAHYWAKATAEATGEAYREHLRDWLQNRVYGIELDALSVEVCKLLLWLELGDKTVALSHWDTKILNGDALWGGVREKKGGVCWGERFRAVFPIGFDFVIGNPPWVSFSGRQAEVLEEQQAQFFSAHYESFAGWKALHSLFVERSMDFMAPQGILGLVLPAQMVDLKGYAPLRAWVRREGAVQEPLPYFGEKAFAGVTQPSFGLIVRKEKQQKASNHPFLMEVSPAFSDRERVWERLDECNKPPADCFRDLGLHTGNCAKKIIHKEAREGAIPIYEGKDVSPFQLRAPRKWFLTSYHPTEGEYYRDGVLHRYETVAILIRQTASRPIAAMHNPKYPFRNSILGCFGIEGVDDFIVLCWLNSTVVAWFHQQQNREAKQQAFPQLKIRHLRNLPLPKWNQALCEEMMGWAHRIDAESVQHLDRLMSHQFGLTDREHRTLVQHLQSGSLRKKNEDSKSR
ncbi:MAG: TaqI-like C-terminal specificity domain-containing protein [Myxococcota bacterium]|nr:TaqI-like C-terminal specificity domain-containing protein [Myxococcota bacterium]